MSESQHRSLGSASCSRRFQGVSPLGLVASCSTLPDPPAFCAAFLFKKQEKVFTSNARMCSHAHVSCCS